MIGACVCAQIQMQSRGNDAGDFHGFSVVRNHQGDRGMQLQLLALGKVMWKDSSNSDVDLKKKMEKYSSSSKKSSKKSSAHPEMEASSQLSQFQLSQASSQGEESQSSQNKSGPDTKTIYVWLVGGVIVYSQVLNLKESQPTLNRLGGFAHISCVLLTMLLPSLNDDARNELLASAQTCLGHAQRIQVAKFSLRQVTSEYVKKQFRSLGQDSFTADEVMNVAQAQGGGSSTFPLAHDLRRQLIEETAKATVRKEQRKNREEHKEAQKKRNQEGQGGGARQGKQQKKTVG